MQFGVTYFRGLTVTTAKQYINGIYIFLFLQEIHENVLRLVRTADQLVHSDLKNAEGVRQRLKTIDDKCEQFMHKMDYRRKNVTMATQFFTLAQAVSINSLWPSVAIWRHRSWSTLAQVMARCLTAPSHYLNQC